MTEREVFGGVFSGRRVLVTGHTGFKGCWLSLWLKDLGAEVYGVSLPPDTEPNMFGAVRLGELVHHVEQDIRDAAAVKDVIADIQPEIVFHLAAQPLVRRSYSEPMETFETNVLGTAYVLDALRDQPATKAIVCVTTDKVYHNNEWERPYTEADHLGGKDPYSASKSAAEMVVGGMRHFFDVKSPPATLVTARGGNVIGGGDWSEDRLIPDLVRAIAHGQALEIRNPGAVRPWQHVLCLCHGYLKLVQIMLGGDGGLPQTWNFGPSTDDTVSVATLLDRFEAAWTLPQIRYEPAPGKPESGLLVLDSAQAQAALPWVPAWTLDEAIAAVAQWYRDFADGHDMRAQSLDQITQYAARIRGTGSW